MVTCSFCKETSISHFMKRSGDLPEPYDPDEDKTHFDVYRFCKKHNKELMDFLDKLGGSDAAS